MYGFQDSGEVAPSKQGGKFGLNQKAFVTKFEYNAKAGSDGADGDAIDLSVQIAEKEYRLRFFPITKGWGENGEITDTTSEAYKESVNKQMVQLNAVLSDIVKCFVDEETLKAALSTPINSFKAFAEILQRLVHSVPNFDKIPVDVFLQYQWKPTGENDKTFLELPKNVKQGIFICKHQEGNFIEECTDTHLRYITPEGITHPFKRGQWFLESNYSKQVDLGTSTSTTVMNQSGNAAPVW